MKIIFMRKILFALVLSPSFLLAQNKEKKAFIIPKEKNIVKVNLSSLALKNIALQYERAIAKKTSLALGLRFQPKGTIPFKSELEKQVDNEDVQIGDFKEGNFAITPEIRFYFGKKEGLKGFYLAPYIRYASFDLEGPISYNSGGSKKKGIFAGKLNSFSGGIMIGSQFKLGKNLMLDWWIAGGHGGFGNGDLQYKADVPLTPSEQSSLKSNIESVDLPFVKFTYNVDANGATIKAQGAWAGLRGFGLNLGYRF
jgi:hypothetical protein